MTVRDWVRGVAIAVAMWAAAIAILWAFDAVAVPYRASSTAYSLCSSGTVMADGTRVRAGSVASNRHALGTRVEVLDGPAAGRYTVRDRIGRGSELDIWMASCSGAIAYGRRVVGVRVGWRVVRRGRVLRRAVAGLGLRRKVVRP